MPKINEFFDDYLNVNSKRCGLIADLHSPYLKDDWFDFFVKLSKKWGMEDCIIGGDLFDQYCFGFVSGFKMRIATHSFRKERDKAMECVTKLLQIYHKLYILPGGHDERILKAVNWQLDTEDVFGFICKNAGDRIKVTNRNYIQINNKFRFYHPKKYSRQPLKKAKDYFRKHPEYHIITGHCHLGDFGFAENGKNICSNIGVMADVRKIPWAIISEDDYPEWVNGFGFIINNYLYPFFEPNCDKKFWLKEGK